MESWIAYHFYPLETHDVFLTRALKPFLAQYIWPTRGARAFFTRYEDEKGPHIRLRLRGETAWVEETLRPAVAGWFAERGERIEMPYLPETDRFGGEDLLPWAEEHFHISTRVVLDRLSRVPYTYGDAMFDALRMHLTTAFTLGLDREETSRYFGLLCEQWLPLFFQPTDGQPADAEFVAAVKESFETSFDQQKEDLRQTLVGFWEGLRDNKYDTEQPEWLRWTRANQLILKEFGSKTDQIVPSLLHLDNNRIGVNNQDEVFLCYIIARAV